MKLLRVVFMGAAWFALAPAGAWAAPGAAGGLQGTAHDFSASGGGVGLCTFCHTPHKAISTQLLWNHTLSTNSFSWDAPTTTAGTNFAVFRGDTYKGPTAKCLSCHDGSVAIGDVAWWKEGKPVAPLNNLRHGAGDTFNVGFGGNMAGNHPVAMPYPFNNVGSTYNGVTTGAAATLTEWRADPTTNNIRLFSDDGAGNIKAGTVATRTGIECSSCHDPHNKASVDDLFLRGTLAGSDTNYICLRCHVK